MRWLGKWKKVLAVSTCAALLSCAGAFTTLADDAVENGSIDLMPKDSDLTVSGGEAEIVDGKLVITADADMVAEVNYDIYVDYNIRETPNLYFSLENQGGWDMLFSGIGGDIYITPGMSADWGLDPDFQIPEGQYGTAFCHEGVYSNKQIDFIGSFNYNHAIDSDGTVILAMVTVKVAPGGTLTLSSLYVGDQPVAESTFPSSETTESSSTDTTVSTDVDTSDTLSSDTEPTQSVTGGGTTNDVALSTDETSATASGKNPPTGESALLVEAGLLLVTSIGAAFLCAGKKFR